MKSTREKILAHSPLMGVFAAIPHPMATEICALAGFDFVCIDWEHSQFGRGTLENLVRAADAQGIPAFVRVPSQAPEHIASALDAGASGLLVPRVSTATEARALVAATRFPPLGTRGVGPGRASGYGTALDRDFLRRKNDEVCLAIQLETANAVQNIEEIAQVEGIDLFFVGPGDLSVSLDADGPALREAIHRIATAVRAMRRPLGIYTADTDGIDQWRAGGFSLFVTGSDSSALAAILQARVSAFHTKTIPAGAAAVSH